LLRESKESADSTQQARAATHQPVPSLLSFQEGTDAKRWEMCLAGCSEKHLSGRHSLGVLKSLLLLE